MARIRSVHPGLFTDEAFVSCSSDAQILFIGLWTEADDQGVFEWKPGRLHMRLLPTKTVDVGMLLDELAGTDPEMIRRFEVDGKTYGAIRKFRDWQKPKSPNAVYPLPPDLRDYVGLGSGKGEMPPPSPPPIPEMEDDKPPRIRKSPPLKATKTADMGKSPPSEVPPFPPNGEIAPLMEEGEGEGKKEPNPAQPEGGAARGAMAVPSRAQQVADRVIDLAGADPSKQAKWHFAATEVAGWLQRGADPDLDIYPAVQAGIVTLGGEAPGSPSYFTKAILQSIERRSRPPPEPGHDRRPPPGQTRVPTPLVPATGDHPFEKALDAWVNGGRKGPAPKLDDYLDAAGAA